MKTKESEFKWRLFVSLCSIALVVFQSCSKDDVGDGPGDEPNNSSIASIMKIILKLLLVEILRILICVPLKK